MATSDEASEDEWRRKLTAAIDALEALMTAPLPAPVHEEARDD